MHTTPLDRYRASSSTGALRPFAPQPEVGAPKFLTDEPVSATPRQHPVALDLYHSVDRRLLGFLDHQTSYFLTVGSD